MGAGHPDHLDDTLEPLATAADTFGIPVEDAETDARPELVGRTEINPHQPTGVVDQRDLAIGSLEAV